MDFKINEKGRDFVVGDLHGMFDMFQASLKDIEFNPEVDRMFSVGDLADRGPDSEKCMRLLEEPWFHAVMGNHEQMFLAHTKGSRERNHFMVNGGVWAVGLDSEHIEELMDLVKDLPLHMTVDTQRGRIGICHAQCPVKTWNDMDFLLPSEKEEAVWGRSRINRRIESKISDVCLTIHGHTVVDNVVQYGNCFFIDTGAVYNGKLTIMQMNQDLRS